MSEEVYGPERAQRLVALLRALAERIRELDRAGRLLDAAPELQKLWETRQRAVSLRGSQHVRYA
jgi:hypothetical protein